MGSSGEDKEGSQVAPGPGEAATSRGSQAQHGAANPHKSSPEGHCCYNSWVVDKVVNKEKEALRG